MNQLEQIYTKINSLSNLKPSKEVNKLFSELVEIATDNGYKVFLSQQKISRLQQLCSKAEYELEKYWAKEILVSDNPLEMLEEFPYYQNYIDLTLLEVNSIRSCSTHNFHKLLFLGSGPLPLTAIILAQKYNIKSTLLDIDEEAVEISQRLIKKLGLSQMISIVKGDATHYKGYGDFEVIFVAALAGTDIRLKTAIFKQIKTFSKKNSHIIARSAWGNRTLLYKPLSREIFSIFQPILKVDPYNSIVNSIVIFKNQ